MQLHPQWVASRGPIQAAVRAWQEGADGIQHDFRADDLNNSVEFQHITDENIVEQEVALTSQPRSRQSSQRGIKNGLFTPEDHIIMNHNAGGRSDSLYVSTGHDTMRGTNDASTTADSPPAAVPPCQAGLSNNARLRMLYEQENYIRNPRYMPPPRQHTTAGAVAPTSCYDSQQLVLPPSTTATTAVPMSCYNSAAGVQTTATTSPTTAPMMYSATAGANNMMYNSAASSYYSPQQMMQHFYKSQHQMLQNHQFSSLSAAAAGYNYQSGQQPSSTFQQAAVAAAHQHFLARSAAAPGAGDFQWAGAGGMPGGGGATAADVDQAAKEQYLLNLIGQQSLANYLYRPEAAGHLPGMPGLPAPDLSMMYPGAGAAVPPPYNPATSYDPLTGLHGAFSQGDLDRAVGQLFPGGLDLLSSPEYNALYPGMPPQQQPQSNQHGMGKGSGKGNKGGKGGNTRGNNNVNNTGPMIATDANGNAIDAQVKAALTELRANKEIGNSSQVLTDPHLMVALARDQIGSRFLQQQVLYLHNNPVRRENDSDVLYDYDHTLRTDTSVRAAFINNLQLGPVVEELSENAFANYVLQRFLDVANDDQRHSMLVKVQPKIKQLLVHSYGCRVIEKAVTLGRIETARIVLREIIGRVCLYVQDANANHVIQKLVDKVPYQESVFILQEILDSPDWSFICEHCYGCRIVQRCLEQFPTSHPEMERFFKKIYDEIPKFVTSRHGNYVVQHLLEYGNPKIKRAILEPFLCGEDLAAFSTNYNFTSPQRAFREIAMNRYGSNVLEKALDVATPDVLKGIFQLICGYVQFRDVCPAILKDLALDKFGNYVVQSMLKRPPNQTFQELLVSQLNSIMPALEKCGYTHQIRNIVNLSRVMSYQEVIAREMGKRGGKGGSPGGKGASNNKGGKGDGTPRGSNKGRNKGNNK